MNFRFVLHCYFMTLPFFYIEELVKGEESIVLNKETSRHIVQVLRMQNGEQVQLTDGRGNLFTAAISDNNKKRCSVNIIQTTNHQPPTTNISIAISLVKNTHRFEWFLEKATEIGITAIIPLICTRTEKQHFRHDRMKSVLVSAMLQSQQCWLPLLLEPIKFNEVISKATQEQKFIAHCEEEKTKVQLASIKKNSDATILIGPEGDFTPDEILYALKNNFTPVALGNTRLRSETAGVVAAALLRLI